MSAVTQGQPTSQHQPGSPWSVRDAAKYLGISERHLIRLIDDSKVSSFMLGRRRLIADAELHRVAEGGVS
ncbi:excisionase family DNA-binding protein [Zavarzinella formosa]|uniref:excisionase family DNA-binding protein n=1 Tax=Zavarzinella formosa TaxID=360055 RepID=UPI0002E8FF15|nr:excisionase family DNA-binding protein [Zavarzinella formosa]